MGCDGGTIPRRDELVKLKKKPEQKDKDSELSFRWRHCSISQQRLQEPIVACGLGRLYSKSSLLESLLDKTTLPETAKHIKNLKDVKDLQLTPNRAYDPDHISSSPYVCPVIGLEMTGRFRFIFLWSCGCVFSERALKAIKSTECHKCHKTFSEQDIVVLNGAQEDIDLMTVRMEARVARAKAEKKSKKSKVTSTETTEIKKEITEEIDTKTETVKNISKPSGSKINGTKPVNSQKGGKRFAIGDNMGDPAFKKAKNEYSVANDPKATDVFKSLFTSHETDKTQERAHWVTYNPFYN